jgi:hypothetical protein
LEIPERRLSVHHMDSKIPPSSASGAAGFEVHPQRTGWSKEATESLFLTEKNMTKTNKTVTM